MIYCAGELDLSIKLYRQIFLILIKIKKKLNKKFTCRNTKGFIAHLKLPLEIYNAIKKNLCDL